MCVIWISSDPNNIWSDTVGSNSLVLTLDPDFKLKLDLAFNNIKPKDWYFVLHWVRFRTGFGYERLIMYHIQTKSTTDSGEMDSPSPNTGQI